MKRLRTALILGVIGAAFTLAFTFARTRRLLAQADRIATQSARFPREYEMGDGPRITYLALGDSTAVGWGAAGLGSTLPYQIASALAARGFRVRVVNAAVGGAALSELRRDQGRFLRSAKPDLVTISIGANDATRGTGDREFEREWRLLNGELRGSGAQSVLISNTPDMFLAPALPYPLALRFGARARSLNRVLMRIPLGSRARIVDIFGQGKLDYRRDSALYAADLFHPSGRGYAVWADLFIQEITAGAKISPR